MTIFDHYHHSFFSACSLSYQKTKHQIHKNDYPSRKLLLLIFFSFQVQQLSSVKILAISTKLISQMATKGQSLDSNVEEWPKEAETEIYDTCFYNNTEKFTNILKIKGQEIDVNKIDQNGSLFIAIDYENVTIVKELLKLGCDPNAKYQIRFGTKICAFSYYFYNMEQALKILCLSLFRKV